MRALLFVLAASFVYASAVFAHHGWSEYDAAKPLTVTGTIVETGYEHPHGHIRLRAGDKTWHVVLAPPSRMQARGLPPTALEPGASVRVHGYPHRAKPEEMRAEQMSVNGKTVELR